MRITLCFDVLDIERRNFCIGSGRTNIVNPRLRISAVDHDERIHLGEMMAAVVLVTLVAGNVVEEERARSILEPSDDFDLGHNRRHIRFHDELDVTRHVAELGLPDACVADDRDLCSVVHLVLGWGILLSVVSFSNPFFMKNEKYFPLPVFCYVYTLRQCL